MANTTIDSGSVFAIAALHMVLLHPCDQVVSRWPLQIYKSMDDVTMSRQADSADVAADFGGPGLVLEVLARRATNADRPGRRHQAGEIHRPCFQPSAEAKDGT